MAFIRGIRPIRAIRDKAFSLCLALSVASSFLYVTPIPNAMYVHSDIRTPNSALKNRLP